MRSSLARVLVLGAALAGCSAEDLEDLFDRDGGAPAGDAGGAGDGGAPGACNALVADGPLVEAAPSSGVLTFLGGTPAPGTYRLTRMETTSGASSTPERRTIAIGATNTLDFVSRRGSGDETRWSATFTTANVEMTVTRTCAGVGSPPQVWKYTATADSLRLWVGAIVYTYERRR